MGFRPDRLKEILAAKKTDRIFLQRETKIPSDEMGRILAGRRSPGVDKISRIVLVLELDADYLIDTDERYSGMEPNRAAAQMSLDRYLIGRSLERSVIPTEDANLLYRLAQELPDPPVWVRDWEKHHAAAMLSLEVRPTSAPPEQRRSSRRRLVVSSPRR